MSKTSKQRRPRAAESCRPAMASRLLLLLATLALLFVAAAGQEGNNISKPFNLSCSTSDNYTDGSQYKKNLDQFLAALPTAAGDNGWFYKGSAGSGPDAVFGLIICFADRDASDCLYCISTASAGITTACLGSRNVSAAYDACVLRYSAAPIPATADLGYVFAEPLTAIGMPVTSEAVPDAYVPLMAALSSGIAFDPSRSFRSSMAYSSTGSQEMKMYGLAQCTRDLNGSECSTCIRSYAIRLGKLFPSHTGCSIKGYSCYLRYQVSFPIDITLPPAPAPAPPTSSPPTPEPSKTGIVVIGVSVGSVSIMIILAIFSIWLLRWRRRRQARILEKAREQELGEGGS
ncbi:antimicrobial ginkbilobin-2-like protein [Miscanthus floridulus]|uniref:antimicrobial ginkbilobin-2-like protein n=1 Tax=Miscanthus floridulus TaxID=154761 RepID=UPI003459FDE4